MRRHLTPVLAALLAAAATAGLALAERAPTGAHGGHRDGSDAIGL